MQLLRHLGKTNHLCISVVTRLEVKVGMQESEKQRTQKLLSRFHHSDVTAMIADKGAHIMAQGKAKNTGIFMPDAIIAATALVHNMTLVTFNLQHFQNVRGLRIHSSSS